MSDILNYVLLHAKKVAVLADPEPSDLASVVHFSLTCSERPKRKLFSVVSRAMQKKSMRAGEGSTPASMPAVFVQCFKFLKALAQNNLEVQQRYVH